MAVNPTAVNRPVGREIPTRRVHIKDASQLPNEYSTTPGGTMFSTTPGGTRIIYDRAFLMHMRESPLAQTPPKNMPNIPGVTDVAETAAATTNSQPPKQNNNSKDGAIIEAEEPQFEMDI